MKKSKSKYWKGKLSRRVIRQFDVAMRLPDKSADGKVSPR